MAENNFSLALPTTTDIKEEMGFEEPTAVSVEVVDPKVSGVADNFVDSIMAIDFSEETSVDASQQAVAVVENFGMDVQKAAVNATNSDMLQQQIKGLAKAGEDGGEIANALMQLNMEVKKLDPVQLDDLGKKGGITKLIGKIFGSKLEKYFKQYESAESIIVQIMDSMDKGAKMLVRDNKIMLVDQRKMRTVTYQIQDTLKMGKLMDQRFSDLLATEIMEEDPKYRFVQDEILFPLRQRINDLQQILAVNQQGVVSLELVIRNNKELIKGVNRAKDVTVTALQIAVTVALALNNQKIVLDKINALNATTNDLIANTAKRINTQGVEIQKQAASSQLDIEVLAGAFAELNSAMDSISTFRGEALPVMAENIVRMDELTGQADDAIRRMEKGNQVAGQVALEAANG